MWGKTIIESNHRKLSNYDWRLSDIFRFSGRNWFMITIILNITVVEDVVGLSSGNVLTAEETEWVVSSGSNR